jgi:coenzyme F420 hydrogenase subunit beta
VPAALITDSEDEVIRCGQTSYCLTPNLQLLRDPRFKRIALIGVPCEVQAVRKMQNLDPLPEVAEKIVLAVEIACASSTRLAGTEFLITEKLGIPLNEVAEMRYREGEYPGQFTVKTHDGMRKSLPFFEVVDEFKRHKTHRCLVCGDWWSGLADVSISDGDPNIYASSQSGAKPPRQSIVMTRTEEGEKTVQAAVRMGLATVTPRAFVAEENLGLQRKRFRYASFAEGMPNRVPAPPVEYQETETLLSDTEVIDRMSYHMKIMPSRPQPGTRRPRSRSDSAWQAPARLSGALRGTRPSPSAQPSPPLSRTGPARCTTFPIPTISKAISAFSASSGSTSGRLLTRLT